MVWQYLNQKRPLNIKAAEAFANGLNVSIEDFSPKLADQIKSAGECVGESEHVLQQETKTIHLLFEQKKNDAYVLISNTSASMGYGIEAPDFEIVVDAMRITKTWVNLELPIISSINNLAILPGYGDSIMPTFNSGDLLFVDRGVTTIKDDAIYVFSIDSDVFVKRIIRNPIKRTLIAKLDNEAYGQFEIESKDLPRMVVHGLIVYAWNGKKL